jgi:NAD(P)-dependent dehydrogenase (short-subunit alcohol dehydrogenase family)
MRRALRRQRSRTRLTAASITPANSWQSYFWFVSAHGLHDHCSTPMTTDGIQGKVAFITGGGAGIGRAIALEWARRGGIPAVSDLDGASAIQTLADAGGNGEALSLDVANGEAIRVAIAQVAGRCGGIDVLFNVAGVNLPKNVEELEEHEWYRIIDINLTSVYRCSKHAIPLIRRRGGGAIVNVASVAGIMAENRCSAYTATKGGVVMLTRNMAMDFAADGIRVNAVCPGGTLTPRIESYMAKEPRNRREMEEMCPLKRMARPEEIARPAVFLASADASYVTGAALVVDGGMTAGFRIAAFDRMKSQ